RRFGVAAVLLPTLLLLTWAYLPTPADTEAPLPTAKVELQPLAAQAKRVMDALHYLGAPLSADDRKALSDARTAKDPARAVAAIQAVLDRRCIAAVHLNKGPTLRAQAGPAKPELAEQGWRVFLVKVYNPTGIDGVRLTVSSPNAAPLTRRSSNTPAPTVVS